MIWINVSVRSRDWYETIDYFSLVWMTSTVIFRYDGICHRSCTWIAKVAQGEHTHCWKRVFFPPCFRCVLSLLVIGCNNHFHLLNWLNAAILRWKLYRRKRMGFGKMKIASIKAAKTRNITYGRSERYRKNRIHQKNWLKFKLTKSNCKCPTRSIRPYLRAHIQSIRCMWMAVSLAWKLKTKYCALVSHANSHR